MLIFQFVSEASIDWQKTGTFYPKHTVVWLEDDPLSPSILPYPPAPVCVRWFHTLSGVAVYWTRQVITMDSHAISPIAIRSLLQWVGNLSLQLIVTRHPGVSGETDGDEYARVRAVLDLFRPHIHHIWSLAFNVRRSCSISALRKEQGDAPHLVVLTLMSGPSDAGSTADLPRLLELHPAGNGNMYNPSLEARIVRISHTGWFLCGNAWDHRSAAGS